MCIQMKWLENCSDIVSKLEIIDHLFSTYAKFSKKLTYQGVRSVSFPENFAYVLNEWSLKLPPVSTL